MTVSDIDNGNEREGARAFLLRAFPRLRPREEEVSDLLEFMDEQIDLWHDMVSVCDRLEDLIGPFPPGPNGRLSRRRMERLVEELFEVRLVERGLARPGASLDPPPEGLLADLEYEVPVARIETTASAEVAGVEARAVLLEVFASDAMLLWLAVRQVRAALHEPLALHITDDIGNRYVYAHESASYVPGSGVRESVWRLAPAADPDASRLTVEIPAMSDSSLSGEGMKKYGLVGPWVLEIPLRANVA